uniref:Uncharacterized protein n=1 Tax=Oryza brachyantha TaxID=4533 RepID=J3LLY9_ORYBR
MDATLLLLPFPSPAATLPRPPLPRSLFLAASLPTCLPATIVDLDCWVETAADLGAAEPGRLSAERVVGGGGCGISNGLPRGGIGDRCGRWRQLLVEPNTPEPAATGGGGEAYRRRLGRRSSGRLSAERMAGDRQVQQIQCFALNANLTVVWLGLPVVVLRATIGTDKFGTQQQDLIGWTSP